MESVWCYSIKRSHNQSASEVANMANNDFTPNELKTEEWRNVAGYEGLYKVSSFGHVMSIRDGRGTFRGRFLVPMVDRCGYCAVVRFKNGKRQRFSQHRLVMECFVGSPPNGCEINHKDGVKSNNRLVNLEYVTRSENMQHAISTLGCYIGENNHNAKLTDEKVVRIRLLLSEGLSHRRIASLFGVNHSQITAIATGKAWKHVR